MKIALVGIGKIALEQHVPALADSEDWELAATCSHVGSVPGVEAYEDFQEMLEQRLDIHTVSFCLPPIPRFDYASRAIAAGRHVMLEKPPGATLSECQALADMARRQGVALYATWHSQQAEKVPAAKAWLADATLRELTVTWKEHVRQWHPGQDWIFEPGGLGAFDAGINALSILTTILPHSIHLTGAELRIPENRDMPIAATCRYHHAGGTEVTLALDFLEVGDPVWSIEAVCDEGTLLLENAGAKMSIDGVVDDSPTGLGGEYRRLYARMAQLVADREIDMDLAPFVHVADAFMLGRRITVEAFEW